MLKFKLILSIVIITFYVQINAQPTPNEWKEYVDNIGKNEASTLLNFSYAGYHFSEKKIPDVTNWKKFDVTDYGAKPNDGRYDDKGIQAAIDAAEAHDGPAQVFFPPGKFRISPNENIEEFITLNGSHIVLKGSGSGPNGTEIYMDKKRVSIKHQQFKIKPASVKNPKITEITREVKRGSHVVYVANSSKLSVGQTVLLRHKSEEFARKHLKGLTLNPKWTRLFGNEGGMNLHEIHVVEKIEGNKITFKNPVQTRLEKMAKPVTITEFNTIEEVGVEDILFSSGWHDFPEEFRHHKNATHDYSYSAFRFEYVQNSWFRNCRFKSWSECINISRCIAMTVENVKIEGKRGHASFICSRSYGLLVRDCVDEAKTDEGKIAGQLHGVGMGYGSANIVYLRCKMQQNQSIDSHSGQPYGTLLDDIDGGYIGGNGGPEASLPHHAQDLVFWNFKHKSSKDRNYQFWPIDKRTGNIFANPMFFGFQPNRKTTFSKAKIDKHRGMTVQPRSLFDAQLKLRLKAQGLSKPTAKFLAPTNNSTFTTEDSVYVEVDACDLDGKISSVDLYLNEQLVRSEKIFPYAWKDDKQLRNLAPGEYTLKAIATDDNGEKAEVSIKFKVKSNQSFPPTISFVAPAPESVFDTNDTVYVEVNAQDKDDSIAYVNLYLNDALVRTERIFPYSWTKDEQLQNLAIGTYTLKAEAFDHNDNSTTATLRFQVDIPTGYSSTVETELQPVPNPFNDHIIVPGENIKEVSLYNIEYKEILVDSRFENSTIIVNTEKLKSGIYILKVYLDSEESKFFKVLKK